VVVAGAAEGKGSTNIPLVVVAAAEEETRVRAEVRAVLGVRVAQVALAILVRQLTPQL
jgi:hypothetical protein